MNQVDLIVTGKKGSGIRGQGKPDGKLFQPSFRGGAQGRSVIADGMRSIELDKRLS